MIAILKKYRVFIVSSLIIVLLLIFNREIGLTALKTTGESFAQMMSILPAIFILLGLLDVWVPREMMVKYMGEGSGVKGIVLSFILGSAAAGPLYGAFPVAAVLMKKGAKFSNILIFLGAWSTTKIPMFLFELSTMGPVFAFTRLGIDIVVIIIIAYTVSALVKTVEKKEIYEKSKEL